ncbi:hypothetical protein BJQ90_02796 [Arthrobacter sp. SO3]|nr:hypothetical protein [Arthrobacter sp. SO3]
MASIKTARVVSRCRMKPVVGITTAIVSIKPVDSHCTVGAVTPRSTISRCSATFMMVSFRMTTKVATSRVPIMVTDSRDIFAGGVATPSAPWACAGSPGGFEETSVDMAGFPQGVLKWVCERRRCKRCQPAARRGNSRRCRKFLRPASGSHRVPAPPRAREDRLPYSRRAQRRSLKGRERRRSTLVASFHPYSEEFRWATSNKASRSTHLWTGSRGSPQTPTLVLLVGEPQRGKERGGRRRPRNRREAQLPDGRRAVPGHRVLVERLQERAREQTLGNLKLMAESGTA